MFSRLVLPITCDCNLNCEYCYVVKRGSRALPFLIGAKAIDFLMENNPEGGVDLIFTGGEPLLAWEKIKKLIFYARQAAKKRNVKIQTMGFPTNGLLLNEKILHFCKKENIKVAVSVDGLLNKRKTMEGFDSFPVLKKKLPLLLKYKDVVRIRMTVWPAYADKLFLSLKFFLKIGFTRIDIQPAIGVRWSLKNQEAYLSNLTKFLKTTEELKEKNRRRIDIKSLRDFIEDPNTEKNCPKVRTEFLVDIDGCIYPCEFFLAVPPAARKKYVIGHIEKGINLKLAENYKNHRVCEARNALSLIKKKCSSCRFSPACFKVCLGFDIQKRRFNRAIAQEGWQLFRGIEKVYSRNISKTANGYAEKK